MPASDLAVYDLQGQVYSYVEVSILIGLLLGSCTVDSIVTGCSCGQEMMLACNSVPGVLCGMIKDRRMLNCLYPSIGGMRFPFH